MARVSTYLNFTRTTEEAFLFYRSVFQTEFDGPVQRYSSEGACPEAPPLSPEDSNLVLHVALPILGGHVLMGSDVPEAFGMPLRAGNTTYINLEPDSRAETDRLFAALSTGGHVSAPLQEMFWGGYWGTCIDRFGTLWMFNCSEK